MYIISHVLDHRTTLWLVPPRMVTTCWCHPHAATHEASCLVLNFCRLIHCKCQTCVCVCVANNYTDDILEQIAQRVFDSCHALCGCVFSSGNKRSIWCQQTFGQHVVIHCAKLLDRVIIDMRTESNTRCCSECKWPNDIEYVAFTCLQALDSLFGLRCSTRRSVSQASQLSIQQQCIHS
jgi:hypothetical protein